jgi:hypothetical protein
LTSACCTLPLPHCVQFYAVTPFTVHGTLLPLLACHFCGTPIYEHHRFSDRNEHSASSPFHTTVISLPLSVPGTRVLTFTVPLGWLAAALRSPARARRRRLHCVMDGCMPAAATRLFLFFAGVLVCADTLFVLFSSWYLQYRRIFTLPNSAYLYSSKTLLPFA